MLYTNLLTILATASLATGAALGTPPDQLARALDQTLGEPAPMPAPESVIPVSTEDGLKVLNGRDPKAGGGRSGSTGGSSSSGSSGSKPPAGKPPAGGYSSNGPSSRNPPGVPKNPTGNNIGSTDKTSTRGGFSSHGSGTRVVFIGSGGYGYYPGGAYYPYYNYGPRGENNVNKEGTGVTPLGPVNLTTTFPGQWPTGDGYAYKLLNTWTFNNATTGKPQTIQVVAVCDNDLPCAAGNIKDDSDRSKYIDIVMPNTAWPGLDKTMILPTVFNDVPTLLLNASVARGTTAISSSAGPALNAKTVYPIMGLALFVSALAGVM